MRLAFAVAINVDPEILLVDEALAVGDIYFRQRCMRKVHELRQRGVTILFVSHAVSDIKAIGDRALWLDHGRMVEIGAPQCIRLARWFAAQTTQALLAAIQRTPRVKVDVAVVVDVFLSADACPVGKTPAFATGPYDALDAVTPARLADAFQLQLVPRDEGPPAAIPAPQNFWPAPGATHDALLAAVLESWEDAPATADETLAPLQEHVDGFDPSAVLLARVTIPVTLAADAPAGTRPTLATTSRVSADNSLRPFIALPGKWVGRAIPARGLIEP